MFDDQRERGGAAVRGWLRRRSQSAAVRARQPPRLVVNEAGPSPTIYYLAPDRAVASGGVRMEYRHVDLLNEMGIDAAILHSRPGFRCTWFANETRVVSPDTIRLRVNDVLVIPEIYGIGLARLPREIRKLVFNQGAYITFDLLDLATTSPGAPYVGVPNLTGIMAVSQDSEDLLRFAFPGIPVTRCRPVVDADIFHPSIGPRQRAFAYVPSRRPDELNQVLHLLRASGVDWDFVPISGLTERQVAETLRRCAAFISLSERDGFGLPPAEAMACGCYVVGYHGGGGREFFDPDYCAPVSTTLELATSLVDVTTRSLGELAALGARASEQILSRYSCEGLRDDLRLTFGPIVG